jgi:hypothetical protein
MAESVMREGELELVGYERMICGRNVWASLCCTSHGV